MANQDLKSLDEYEVFLTEKMTPWSPQQRVALAAAIAEHWLPAYESFSAEEDWGDPASLRRSLDAVWSHVQGGVLAERDVARHFQQVEEVTPHMDAAYGRFRRRGGAGRRRGGQGDAANLPRTGKHDSLWD
jgi:hypothetical protein